MTSIVHDDGLIRFVHADAIEALRELPDESVDAVVTDPPYGLEFMNKEWDGADGFRRSLNPNDAGRDDVFGRTSTRAPEYRVSEAYGQWCKAWATECLRALKSGGYLLAFGGTRTYHHLAYAIEASGFEIRDCLVWGYASGFPKSLDVSKAVSRIDPAAAERWRGFGTALKPAWEPIVMARKPVRGTVAANILAYGTGALNIDAARIPVQEGEGDPSAERKAHGYSEAAKKALGATVASESLTGFSGEVVGSDSSLGRWPANVMLTDPIYDGEYPDTVVGGGTSQSGFMAAGTKRTATSVDYGVMPDIANLTDTYADAGGKSRFFLIPKADRSERERGLDGRERGQQDESRKPGNPGGDNPRNRGVNLRANTHPTVKPLDLMVHLVKLVTPPGGVVVDPFVGSGTTALAASELGLRCIGIDQSADYLEIAKGRLMATPIGMGLVA